MSKSLTKVVNFKNSFYNIDKRDENTMKKDENMDIQTIIAYYEEAIKQEQDSDKKALYKSELERLKNTAIEEEIEEMKKKSIQHENDNIKEMIDLYKETLSTTSKELQKEKYLFYQHELKRLEQILASQKETRTK